MDVHVHIYHHGDSIMADLTRLSAAVAAIETKTDTLIATCKEIATELRALQGNADQPTLDALALRLETAASKEDAEVATDAPPVPPTP